MTEATFSAYGVHVLSDDGEPIDLNDLSPLMSPTKELLRHIEEAGGPRINPFCIRRQLHNLPLASIDGTPVLCSFLCEETSDPIESHQLVKARRQELSRLFTSLMTSSRPPSTQFAGNAKAIRAIFLLFAAFETAQIFATSGYSVRTINGYTFEAASLRVSELDGRLTFEIVTNIAAELHRDQTLH